MIRPEILFKNIYPTGAERPLSVAWTVDAHLPYFDGHFPQNPILPAIAIVDASTVILQRALDRSQLNLKKISAAKFLSPIVPGQKVKIELQRMGELDWLVEWKEDPSHRLLVTLRVQL